MLRLAHPLREGARHFKVQDVAGRGGRTGMQEDGARRRRLRELLAERRAMLVPGAADALTARIIEELGFAAVYASGAGITNSRLALPDLGFLGLAELESAVRAMRGACELPLLVDADTGFGNALNVYETVRRLERAGADAVQIEDQLWPKRCGHFAGKAVIPPEEMEERIRAARAARCDPDLLIVARTDARAVLGFEEAIARARRYRAAGADLLFLEAPESEAELAEIPRRLPDAPLMVNMVIGGRTPILPQERFAAMGYALLLYANAALQGAIHGMTRTLGVLRERGMLEEDPELLAPFAERQKLVRKPFFDALGQRFADPPERGA